MDRKRTLKSVSTQNLNFYKYKKNTSSLNSPLRNQDSSRGNSPGLSRLSSNQNSSKNLSCRRRTFREKLKQQEQELEKCRKSAKDIINSCSILNSDLQFKMSYFYGPYNGTTRQTPLIPMKFGKSSGKLLTTVEKKPVTWKGIGNLILKNKTDYVRECLKCVNGDLYSRLKTLGEEVIEEEFEEVKKQLTFSKHSSENEAQSKVKELMERSNQLIRCDTEDNCNAMEDEESVVAPLLKILKHKKPVIKENLHKFVKRKASRRITFTKRRSQDFTVQIGNLDVQSKKNIGSIEKLVKKSKSRKRLMTVDTPISPKNSKLKNLKTRRSVKTRPKSCNRLVKNLSLKALPRPKILFAENSPFTAYQTNNFFEKESTGKSKKTPNINFSSFSTKTSGFLSSRSHTKSKVKTLKGHKSTFCSKKNKGN